MNFESPQFEAGQESIDKLREKAVMQGAEEAQMKIKQRFENPLDEKNYLPFHDRAHTESVMSRTERILDAIQKVGPDLVSDKDVQNGILAAAFHDTVNSSEENIVRDGDRTKIMRKRFTGNNEQKSADEAVEFMGQAATESKAYIFSKNDVAIVREAIAATVPDFNPEKKTVVQPNLKEESSIVARALALADLGTAGMDGPKKFLKEGDDLFREENLDIAKALLKPEQIDEAQKDYFRQRMLGWTKFQPAFARGRKELLDDELRGFPEKAKDAIKKLFDKFDLSIQAAGERAKRREEMSCEEIARDMGYKIYTEQVFKKAA